MKLVTIYVDEDEWEDVKRRALQLSAEHGERISIGSYLVALHKSSQEQDIPFQFIP